MRQNLSLLLAASVAAIMGCNTREFGSSVGRPASDSVNRPQVSPLMITEIYVAPVSTEQFVEISAREPVNLNGYSLCGTASCTDLDGELSSLDTFDIGDLGLNPSHGELAVLDDTDEVVAYAAWGADPTVLGSPWMARALARGVTKAGSFAALPFPMVDETAVVFNSTDCDSNTCGCATPSPGSLSSVSPCAETRFPLELNELWTDGETSWVELFNASTEDAINLEGVRLCQLPSCVVFGARQLNVGAYLLVHLGVEAPSTLPADNAVYFANARPLALGGELVLLAPGGTDIAAEIEALLSFVRFGSTLATLSRTAVLAGVWNDLLATARMPLFANEALSRSSVTSYGANTWHPAAVHDGVDFIAGTPGIENPDISEASDEWFSCSFPRPWRAAPASELVIQTISGMNIEIANRTDNDIDLSDWVLELDGTTQTFSEETLEPMGRLQVPLSAELQTNHELSLHDAGAIKQYIRLGAPDSPTRLQDAIDAGVWPLERCSIALDGTLTLRQGETGQSPADYF